MAQYRIDNKQLGQPGTRFEVMMIADEYGRIINLSGLGGSMASSSSAFGEPLAIPLTPVIQVDAIYGQDTRKFYTYTANGASTTVNDVMTVSTGTTSNALGILRSRRAVRYRPGQGALARFTAQFTTPVAGYLQFAGFLSDEGALGVGYNGTQFGVLRRNLGRVHIHQFTVTAVPTGTETVTITLNGTAYTVSVSGATTQAIATLLGNASYNHWRVEYAGSTVYFVETTAGVRSGTFSFATQVGGTCTTTNAAVQAGVAHTDTWTYQSDWNFDPLDGTGASQMTLNPQKLNVYQINFRWLGAGEMRFSVENDETGDMMYFHHEHYGNRYTTPHMQNPTFQVGYLVHANSAGGSNVSVSGASILGAIEGTISPISLPTCASVSRTDNLTTGSTYHVATLHNRLMFKDRTNQREVIVKTISGSATTAGSVPARISLYVDPVMTANLAFYPVGNTTMSTLFYSNTQTTLNTTASFPPVYEFEVSSGAPITQDISDLRLVLWPGSHLTVAVTSTGTVQTSDAAITVIED